METIDYDEYIKLVNEYFILKAKHRKITHCKGCGKKSINNFVIGENGEYIRKCSNPSKPGSKKCNYSLTIIPPKYMDYNEDIQSLKKKIDNY